MLEIVEERKRIPRRRNQGYYMVKKFAKSFFLTLAVAATAFAQPPAGNNKIQTEIESVLHAQQQAWNRHDLHEFMSGYWNSPQLTFFSGAKEHDGWQGTLDRYIAAYSSPGHEMGKLEFSNLRVEPLAEDAAFVRGSWQLTMPDSKTPHGLFTLIFRKFPDGWKIIHDHTSAE